MIVIPLVGNSTRFFDAGFTEIKYKLKIGNNKSIIENILKYIPEKENILLICNEKYKDKEYLNNLCHKMGFQKFSVVEINDTDGQLTTVELGLELCQNTCLDEELWIYNGDTIRKKPFVFEFEGDGMIEVFIEKGTHWSFVDTVGKITNVEEKVRISRFCCTGLYGFRTTSIFFEYSKKTQKSKGERYVAPIYKVMLKDKKHIVSFLSERHNFLLCGTPDEYLETCRNN